MTASTRVTHGGPAGSRPGIAARAGAAATLGVVHALSFAPWPAWWLQLASLAALLVLLDRCVARHGARRLGWIAGVFGVGWFTAGVHWLYVSMHHYGGLPAPLAAIAVLLLAGYLAIYPTVALRLAGAPARAGGRVGGLIAQAATFAALWTITEWLRGVVFTGFPWIASGYAHVDGPLAGWAPVLGVYGIGFFSAAAAFLLARAVLARKATAAIAAAIGIGIPFGVGQALRAVEWSLPHGAPIKVRLVQGNVPQELKFSPVESRRAMDRYAWLVADGDADLTVLPETAWVTRWESTPDDVIRAMFPRGRAARAVALGAPARPVPLDARASGDTRAGPGIANSVLLLVGGDPVRVAGQYDKQHLVPFGEFVPPGFGWFVRMMNIPLGDFARGDSDPMPLAVAGQRVAFNICYEDLFGAQIRLPVLGDDTRRGGATILANVTNVAWFGRTTASSQHLQIARMRTLETARPMIRATNTGVTASIDAQARVVARLEDFTIGVLDGSVQGMTGLTPYVRLGNSPLLIVCFVLCAWALWRARKR